MKRARLHLLCMLLCALWLAPLAPLWAQSSDPTPLQFRDDAEEARFHRLTAELRCVMCQNQSLADSNAQIAHDLRREVLDLMREGRSDAQIKQFLVDRYGEFVLYKPEMSGHWLLWSAPVALVLMGGVVVMLVVRRRSARATPVTEDEQEW